MARKSSLVDFAFREADARAKAFDTKYYTADIHKGATSPIPFVAEALGA